MNDTLCNESYVCHAFLSICIIEAALCNKRKTIVTEEGTDISRKLQLHMYSVKLRGSNPSARSLSSLVQANPQCEKKKQPGRRGGWNACR